MISLKPYNTFQVNHYCEELHLIHDIRDVHDLIPFEKLPLIIGGGSNILLTRDVSQPVLINEIKGKEIVDTTDDYVVVKIGGGEVWHDVVMWAIENDLGGIENLSLIPGKCGAAPIQNIGAYGVEVKDHFVRLDAINLLTGEKEYFEKEDCQFGYRESIFKHEARGDYFILNIYLKLSLPHGHRLVLSYGRVEQELAKNNVTAPTIKDVSDAIIAIRKSKLPDPEKTPNCGSFFKNPIITLSQYQALKKKHPQMPQYPLDDHNVKVPAGWLIDQCGWKGKRYGDVGCHEDHALVLCNYGVQFGKEIARLAQKIMKSVEKKYNIKLEPEVNYY